MVLTLSNGRELKTELIGLSPLNDYLCNLRKKYKLSNEELTEIKAKVKKKKKWSWD